MTCADLVRVNAPLPSEQEGRAVLNERTRLAPVPADVGGQDLWRGRPPVRRCAECTSDREGVFEAAAIRKVANLIESGEL